jgi:hypothetical protein
MFGCSDKLSAMLGLYDKPIATDSLKSNLANEDEE